MFLLPTDNAPETEAAKHRARRHTNNRVRIQDLRISQNKPGLPKPSLSGIRPSKGPQHNPAADEPSENQIIQGHLDRLSPVIQQQLIPPAPAEDAGWPLHHFSELQLWGCFLKRRLSVVNEVSPES